MIRQYVKNTSLVLSMVALGTFSSVASAVTGDQASQTTNINTSMVWADSGTSYHACNVVNVTTSTQNINVDLISSSGTVLATTGATAYALAPGAFLETSAFGGYSGFARCRIKGANPANLRANITVFRYTGTYYESLAVSEAR